MKKRRREVEPEPSLRSLKSKRVRLQNRLAEMVQMLPAWHARTLVIRAEFSRAETIRSRFLITKQEMALEAYAEVYENLRTAYVRCKTAYDRWQADNSSAWQRFFGSSSKCPTFGDGRAWDYTAEQLKRMFNTDDGGGNNVYHNWSMNEKYPKSSSIMIVLNEQFPSILEKWHNRITAIPLLRSQSFSQMKEAFCWRDFTELFDYPSDPNSFASSARIGQFIRTWFENMEMWERSHLTCCVGLLFDMPPLPDLDAISGPTAIAHLTEELRLLDERTTAEMIENAGHDRIKAAAAAHFGRTRKLGAKVKEQIRHQMEIVRECPFCGGVLGDDSVADHIHPVGHGGLSTPENMVYICYSCNEKKSDKTLREFVKLMGFDWNCIEPRLDKLGKRY